MDDDYNTYTNGPNDNVIKGLSEEKSSEGLLITLAVFLVILIPLCIVGGLYLFRNKTENPEIIPAPPMPVSTPVVSDDEVDFEPEADADEINLPERMTYFTGYEGEMLTVSENTPLYLRNEIDNAQANIYMQYQIYDDKGGMIYESKLLEAGTSEEWRVNYFLPQGEYLLRFHMQPYKMEDDSKEALSANMLPLNYIDQYVNLQVM